MNRKTVLFVALIVALAAYAHGQQSCPESHFRRERVGNSVRITGHVGNNTNVRIPAQIQGMPVVEIGEQAFLRRNLASVVTTGSVTSIGESAFSDNRFASWPATGSATVAANAFVGNPIGTQQPAQSLGNLRNTRWHYSSTHRETRTVGGGMSYTPWQRQPGSTFRGTGGWTWSPGTTVETVRTNEQVINFGNGDFNWQTLMGSGRSGTGTFHVSGNRVYLTFSDGRQVTGQIIEQSISFPDGSFNRI